MTSSRPRVSRTTSGYQFVDVKACHGYLGHELLGARAREGRTAARSRTGCASCARSSRRMRAAVPGLLIAVRLSAFDMVPFRKRERRRRRAGSATADDRRLMDSG